MIVIELKVRSYSLIWVAFLFDYILNLKTNLVFDESSRDSVEI